MPEILSKSEIDSLFSSAFGGQKKKEIQEEENKQSSETKEYAIADIETTPNTQEVIDTLQQKVDEDIKEGTQKIEKGLEIATLSEENASKIQEELQNINQEYKTEVTDLLKENTSSNLPSSTETIEEKEKTPEKLLSDTAELYLSRAKECKEKIRLFLDTPDDQMIDFQYDINTVVNDFNTNLKELGTELKGVDGDARNILNEAINEVSYPQEWIEEINEKKTRILIRDSNINKEKDIVPETKSDVIEIQENKELEESNIAKKNALERLNALGIQDPEIYYKHHEKSITTRLAVLELQYAKEEFEKIDIQRQIYIDNGSEIPADIQKTFNDTEKFFKKSSADYLSTEVEKALKHHENVVDKRLEEIGIKEGKGWIRKSWDWMGEQNCGKLLQKFGYEPKNTFGKMFLKSLSLRTGIGLTLVGASGGFGALGMAGVGGTTGLAAFGIKKAMSVTGGYFTAYDLGKMFSKRERSLVKGIVKGEDGKKIIDPKLKKDEVLDLMAHHEANGFLMQKDFSKDPVYGMLKNRYKELVRTEIAPEETKKFLKESEIDINGKIEKYRSVFKSGERKRKTSAVILGLALGTLGLHNQLFGHDITDKAGNVTKHITGVLEDPNLHPTNPILRGAIKILSWGQDVPEYPKNVPSETEEQIKQVVSDSLKKGDMVVVGETPVEVGDTTVAGSETSDTLKSVTEGGNQIIVEKSENVIQEAVTNIPTDTVIKVVKGQTLWSIFQDHMKGVAGFNNLSQGQQENVIANMVKKVGENSSQYGLTDVNKLDIGQELPIGKMIEDSNVNNLIKNAHMVVEKTVEVTKEIDGSKLETATQIFDHNNEKTAQHLIESIKENVDWTAKSSNGKLIAIYDAIVSLDGNNPTQELVKKGVNAIGYMDTVEGFPNPKNSMLVRYLIETARDNGNVEDIIDAGLNEGQVNEIITSLESEDISNFEWSNSIASEDITTHTEKAIILSEKITADIDSDLAREATRGAIAKAYDVFAACSHDVANFDEWISKKGASLLQQEEFRDAMLKKLKNAEVIASKLLGDDAKLTDNIKYLTQTLESKECIPSFAEKGFEFAEHLKDIAGSHDVSSRDFIDNLEKLSLGDVANMIKEQTEAQIAGPGTDYLYPKPLPYKQEWIDLFQKEVLDVLPEGSNLATNQALREMKALTFMKSIYK